MTKIWPKQEGSQSNMPSCCQYHYECPLLVRSIFLEVLNSKSDSKTVEEKGTKDDDLWIGKKIATIEKLMSNDSLGVSSRDKWCKIMNGAGKKALFVMEQAWNVWRHLVTHQILTSVMQLARVEAISGHMSEGQCISLYVIGR